VKCSVTYYDWEGPDNPRAGSWSSVDGDGGGKTVSLSVEDVVRQYGDAGRYGVTSNSLVRAVTARRLGWSHKAPSLTEYFESRR
jgi:hypothetical protein